jgi:ribosomal protein L24, bacterial/organelle
MLKLRKDDEVVILAGKDKGKRGKVLKVLRSESRVLVEKVNMIKRHVRPDRMGKPGGIVEKEAPLHISNVAFSMLLRELQTELVIKRWKANVRFGFSRAAAKLSAAVKGKI